MTQCSGPLTVQLDARVGLFGGRSLSLPSLFLNAATAAPGAVASTGFMLHGLPVWPQGCTVALDLTVVDSGALPAALAFNLVTDAAEVGGEFRFPTPARPGALVTATALPDAAPWVMGSMTSSEPMLLELRPAAPLTLQIVGMRFVFAEQSLV